VKSDIILPDFEFQREGTYMAEEEEEFQGIQAEFMMEFFSDFDDYFDLQTNLKQLDIPLLKTIPDIALIMPDDLPDFKDFITEDEKIIYPDRLVIDTEPDLEV